VCVDVVALEKFTLYYYFFLKVQAGLCFICIIHYAMQYGVYFFGPTKIGNVGGRIRMSHVLYE